MRLPVLISRRATRDISKILAWIGERSSAGAQKWLMALEGTLTHLPDDVATSTSAPEAEDLGIDLRQCSFKTRRGHIYRLVFAIRTHAIHVLAVRGAGQDQLQSDDIEALE